MSSSLTEAAETTRTTARWLRVGRSLASDARTAGQQAAAEALQGAEDAGLLLVFCSTLYDLTQVTAGVCAATPDDVPVAGCTSMGEIAPSGPGLHDLGSAPAVVAIALGGPGFEVATTVVRNASERRRDVGAESAEVMSRISAPHKVFLMLADGLTREQHEIVRGAYAVLGASVPIAGGCSADEMVYECTSEFYGTGAGVQILTDALVGIALGSQAPIGFGVSHGWSKTGEPMLVTSSHGGEVILLDGEPALDVFLARIGADRSLLTDAMAFREAAFKHPLGLSRRSGEDLRVVHDFNEEKGSVGCLADVPQGALAWMMTTEPDALVEAAAQSCEMAVQSLGGADPLGFMVFDCCARKIKLGPENIRAEQDAIEKLTGGAPFGGFYTYGEIGRMAGSRGMHQLTVVTLALA